MSRTVAGVVAAVLAGAGSAHAQDAAVVIRKEVAIRKAELQRRIERNIVVQAGQQRGGDRRFPASDSRTEKRSLAIGASGSLELRNYGGDIVVTAASGNEATIEIVRSARGRTDADVKRALEEVTVQVDHRGDRATVQVNDPRMNSNSRGRDDYQVSVSYTVAAPAGTRLNVNSLGADVRVTGIKGDVAVEVAGGDVVINGSRVSRAKSMGGDITLTDVDAEGTLDVGTFGGDVLVERARARRLAAETMGGNVVARDVTADETSLKTLSGDVEFAGALTKNGRYELRTHSGDVRVTVTGNTGFEIDATTFSGSIQPAANLSLQSTSRNNRSLRGVVGDGGARIIAAALSGDVIIGKK